MELTTQIQSLLQSDKAKRNGLAAMVLNEMEEGNIDPLQFHVQIKNMEAVLSMFTDSKSIHAPKYKSIVLSEASKHGKKFTLHNAEFQEKETGVQYDYAVCNDPIIVDLQMQMTALKERIKERETFLKSIPVSGVLSVNEETGETGTIYPPAKSSTTTIAVTLK